MKRKLLLVVLIIAILAMGTIALTGCNDSVSINSTGAKALIDWLSTDEALDLIKDYGTDEYGEALFFVGDDVQKSTATIPKATKKTKNIRLSTTTSVNDSGLLDAILPIFEQKYGYDVSVISAGTGAAIEAARLGNADLILVHSKSQEDVFVSEGYAQKLEGYASERISFMYNYFVLVGSEEDPAQVKNAQNIKAAFEGIADSNSTFISRGDKSGTHSKEISLWNRELNITLDSVPEEIKNWYISTGSGMGASLTMANEERGYILTDKSTFLSFKKGDSDSLPNLTILYEEDDDLKNTYTIIAVNPDAEFKTP